MNIAVVGGAGHVGLPLAAMLASVGHRVRAIDTDTERIRSIQGGRSPFYEPGLDNILAQVLADAMLTAYTDLTAAQKCDVVFVAVGTDLSDSHTPQNETVFSVIRQLREVVSSSTVVVLPSTVMPGHNKAVRASLSFRQLLLVATGVGLAFVAYSVVFGSGDIEEAANSSYSIGALPPERRVESSGSGIQTILGVPVDDTAQGTGD